jgi:hypothetical protein
VGTNFTIVSFRLPKTGAVAFVAWEDGTVMIQSTIISSLSGAVA